MSEIKYHDGAPLLSYNKLLVFDTGGRSIGKSFFWKLFVVNNFLKKGRKFIYLRRRKNDINLMNKNNKFWGDISIKLEGHELSTVSGETLSTFTIDGQECGYGLGLSSVTKMKSVPFPDVDYIIFDEFIDEQGSYLGGKENPYLEPKLCASLLMSVARGNGEVVREEVKMIFIGNTHDPYNPYFMYHKISERFKEDTKIIRGNYWVASKDPATEIAEAISKTQLGEMLKNTEYGNMAIGGGWENNNREFIEKRDGEKKYMCSLRSNKQHYGVYETQDGYYYICRRYDPNFPRRFALSYKDKTGDFILVASTRCNAWVLQVMWNLWMNNRLLFEDGEVKAMWHEYALRRKTL